MTPRQPTPAGPEAGELARRVRAGDRRALARALTLAEDGSDGCLGGLLGGRVRAQVVGVTGAPGTGKSTLIGRLALHLRRAGRRVGILAVDPSSPFTGGALLGDRLRMPVPSDDAGLFVRSVASRGQQGGLALGISRMVRVLDAAGMDPILVETVGAGQNDVGVLGVADTVVLVMGPASGDEIQALKAGIAEIGDIMVVSKADLPGADEAYRAVVAALETAPPPEPGWQVPVVRVSSARGSGFDELMEALERHRAHLQTGAHGQRRRLRRAEWELRAAVLAAVERRFVAPLTRSGGWADLVERLAAGELTAEQAAEAVLGAVSP